MYGALTGIGVLFCLGVGAFFLLRILLAELGKSREVTQRNLEEALTRSRMESRQGLQMVIDDLQTRLGSLQHATESKLELIRNEVDKKLSETVTKNFESFGAVSK